MYLFKLLIPILFISSAATAADISPSIKYVSAAVCAQAFTNLPNPPAGVTATIYCADKIMGPLEICIDNKIKEYLTTNKIMTLSDMTNTEQIALQNKYRYSCQATVTQQAVTAQQLATANAARNQAASGAGMSTVAAAVVGGVAGAAVSTGYQNAMAATKIAQVGVGISDNIDKKIEKANAANGKTTTAAAAAPPEPAVATTATTDNLAARDAFRKSESENRSQPAAAADAPTAPANATVAKVAYQL